MNGHAPDADAATQAIFDQGHEVVDLSKSLYAGGVAVNAGTTAFQQIIRASLEAARARKPISEAGLVYDDGFARANVLMQSARTPGSFPRSSRAPRSRT